MKIKKVIDLCKKDGVIFLIDNPTDGQQYVSNGAAVYPLIDTPDFNENSLCATYDINDKQRSKIHFRYDKEFPRGLSFEDTTTDETPCNIFDLKIDAGSGIIIPITTETGLMFIQQKYLIPLTDMPEHELRIFKRTDNNGQAYFAIKFGLLVYALVYPIDIVNETFVEKLNNLSKMSQVLLSNKVSSGVENEAEKIINFLNINSEENNQ